MALSLERCFLGKNVEESDEIFHRAAKADCNRSGIVAVKGLGRYHLVCDAANESALAALRQRKHRPGKAFAVMVASVEGARALCEVNDAKRASSPPARPIVLLRKRPDATFAKGLADNLPELGVMLPTTPVQHLLRIDVAACLL